MLIAFSFRGSRWIRLSCFTWAHSSPPNPRSRSLFRGREFRHSEGYQGSHFLTHTFSDVSQGTSSGVTSSPSTSTPRTFFTLIKASQPSQTFKKVTGNEAHFDLFHHTQQAYARHTSITTAHLVVNRVDHAGRELLTAQLYKHTSTLISRSARW